MCLSLFNASVSTLLSGAPPLPYISLPLSYLHHPSHLTSLLLWHLLLLTSDEDGERNLLSCDLHYSGHFLINATDKTVVYHLMWMQQATPDQKFHYYPLTFTLFRLQLSLRILYSTLIHFFPSSGSFLPQAHGLQYSHTNAATLQLHPRSSGSHNFYMCHNF